MPNAMDIVSHFEPESDENPWCVAHPPEETIEVVAYDPDWPATFDKLSGASQTPWERARCASPISAPQLYRGLRPSR